MKKAELFYTESFQFEMDQMIDSSDWEQFLEAFQAESSTGLKKLDI